MNRIGLFLGIIFMAIALLYAAVAKGSSCTPEQLGSMVVCNPNQVATWNGDATTFNLDWVPSQDGTLSGEQTRQIRSFVPAVPAGTYTVTSQLGLVMVKDPSQDWTELAEGGQTFTIPVTRELVVEIYGVVTETATVALLQRVGGIDNNPLVGATYVAFQLDVAVPQNTATPTVTSTVTPSPTPSPTPTPTSTVVPEPSPEPTATPTATPDPKGPIQLVAQPAKADVGQQVLLAVVNPQADSTYFWVMSSQGDGFSSQEFPSATTMWVVPGSHCATVTESPSGRTATVCIVIGRQIFFPAMNR